MPRPAAVTTTFSGINFNNSYSHILKLHMHACARVNAMSTFYDTTLNTTLLKQQLSVKQSFLVFSGANQKLATAFLTL